MKTIKSQFLENMEGYSDEKLYSSILALESEKIDTVNWPEYPYAPKVSFRVAHSDKAVAVMYEVSEDNVRAVSTESNGPVWEDSCVEFFIKHPVNPGYFNIEINCIGTALAAYRLSREDASHFSEEKMAKIRRVHSLPHEPIDSHEKGKKWWMIEVVPFELLDLPGKPERLRANFYKCGDKCEKMHFLSWNPIEIPNPDFHRPDFFGEIIF